MRLYVAGQVPISRPWPALPRLPTVSEAWPRLLEAVVLRATPARFVTVLGMSRPVPNDRSDEVANLDGAHAFRPCGVAS
jgi:hypothetical protein